MAKLKVAAPPPPPAPDFIAQLTVRRANGADRDWIEALHRLSFGPGRYARAAFRVRERIDPDPALSFLADFQGKPVASVMMTPIAVGGALGYLLGPLATDPAHRNKGAGRLLVGHATEAADADPTSQFVLLVGDEPYYGPLGFKPTVGGAVGFPGPVDPARILVHCDAALIARLKGSVGARTN
ncbi:MAG: N-acetyltransferase [Cucumibacter sp.]